MLPTLRDKSSYKKCKKSSQWFNQIQNFKQIKLICFGCV